MTTTDLFPEPLLWTLPVQELLAEDDMKRLPPLFYDEETDIENLLLVHKLVAVHNPMLEVYLYEHEDGMFSAMFVERGVDKMFFSLNFVQLGIADQPRRFEHIRGFKPRTIGELFNEAEAGGLKVVAEEHGEMLAELSEEFFPPVSD